MRQKRKHRIAFYMNDEEHEPVQMAVVASDLEPADWFREAVASAAAIASSGTPQSNPETQAALAAAQERIHGQDELIQQMRERQGMSDSLNQELNQRLKEAHASSDRLQLMLPAPASNGHRQWWRLW